MEKEQHNENGSVETVGLFRELSDHAKTQIDRAWKAYALLASVLGIIISVGLILLYFMYGNSYKSLENSIQERTNIVQEQVAKRIANEFDAQNVKDLIQTAANEAAIKQIDVIKIRDIIDNEVDTIVRTKVEDLKKQIQILKAENEKALDSLSILADLNLALSNASYEIDSLRILKEIVNSPHSQIALVAKKHLKRTIEEIKRDHNRLISDYWGWKDINDQYFGLKSTKDWKLEDYLKNYGGIPNDQKVVYVNKYLSNDNQDEISKLNFSYSILEIEKKPEIVYTICAFVNTKANLNKDYLFESEAYISWLKDKK